MTTIPLQRVRLRRGDATPDARRAGMVAAVATGIAGAGIALIDTSGLEVLTQVSSTVSRVGIAAAGLLLVVLSRLRPGGPHAWLGVGLLVLSGFGGIFQAVWGLALNPVVAYTVLVPVAVVALFLGARTHDESRLRTVAVAVAGAMLLGLLLALHLGDHVHGPQALLGAGALAAAAVRFARPNRLSRARSDDLLLALSAMATASALTPFLPGVAVAGTRSALLVGAAVGLLVMAAHCTHEAVVTTHRTVDRLVVDLTAHERASSRLREHMHDARSTLAGIRATREALSRPSVGHLDVAARSSLETAIQAEVSRLERLLGSETAEVEVMSLTDLVQPVLIGMRERGLHVVCQPVDVDVRACRDAVAEILTNVLDNCLHHAPGATARITVDATGDVVLVSVMDNGPGIEPGLRGTVFDTGVRGRDGGRGQGIGLAASRRLAREQGGDLRLVDASGGCWFVLRLPAA